MEHSVSKPNLISNATVSDMLKVSYRTFLLDSNFAAHIMAMAREPHIIRVGPFNSTPPLTFAMEDPK